jgi:hypothetical protein
MIHGAHSEAGKQWIQPCYDELDEGRIEALLQALDRRGPEYEPNAPNTFGTIATAYVTRISCSRSMYSHRRCRDRTQSRHRHPAQACRHALDRVWRQTPSSPSVAQNPADGSKISGAPLGPNEVRRVTNPKSGLHPTQLPQHRVSQRRSAKPVGSPRLSWCRLCQSLFRCEWPEGELRKPQLENRELDAQEFLRVGVHVLDERIQLARGPVQ